MARTVITKQSLLEQNKRLVDTIALFEERIAEIELARDNIGWEKLGVDQAVEVSLDYLRRMVATSRVFFLQNPLINRAVTLQCDYVFAQGVNIQARDKDVNAVIQEFLDDQQNKKEITAHKGRLEKEQTLILDGNVFLVLFTDTVDTGKVKVRSILVEEITDIITNPDDANEIWFYKREWSLLEEGVSRYTRRAAYYPDIDYRPLEKPSVRNELPIYWDAPIIHVKSGSLAKSRYGVPETWSAIDWARAHTKMLQDWATIINAYAKFAFKITVNGGKNSVAAARQKLSTTVTAQTGERNPAPLTGSIFTKTDGYDIEPVKTSGATTSAKDARELRIMVAAAMGLPDPMLSGEVDVGNLATAKTLDRPTELKFRSRQQLWTDVYTRILDHVIRASVLAENGLLRNKVKTRLDHGGLILDDKQTDLHVEVTFPPILEKSITERIDAVIGAVTLNGKAFAIDSPEYKKMTVRLMLQALGLKDVDELVDEIFDSIDDTQLTDNPNNDVTKDVPNGSGSTANGSTSGDAGV